MQEEQNYVKAVELVYTLKYVGLSILNRKLSIGYATCNIYLRKMEVDGIIEAMNKDGIHKVKAPLD